MKIGVIGAGRLGICFALLAESAGHDVYVSDVRPSYVAQINAREMYSNEPEVEDLCFDLKNLDRLQKMQKLLNNPMLFLPLFLLHL